MYNWYKCGYSVTKTDANNIHLLSLAGEVMHKYVYPIINNASVLNIKFTAKSTIKPKTLGQERLRTDRNRKDVHKYNVKIYVVLSVLRICVSYSVCACVCG